MSPILFAAKSGDHNTFGKISGREKNMSDLITISIQIQVHPITR